MAKFKPYLETLLRSENQKSQDEALWAAQDKYNDLQDRLEGTKREISNKRRALTRESRSENCDIDKIIDLEIEIEELVGLEVRLQVLNEQLFPDGEPKLPEGEES